MIDPALLLKARRLLDRARLIAEAPAAQLSPIGSGHPTGSLPAGLHFNSTGSLSTASSTLEVCGARINSAIATGSDEVLAQAIRWWTGEIDSLQHSAAGGGETLVERNHRICTKYSGVLAGVVAREERMSVTMIRKIRAEGGRDPRTGYEAQEAVTGEGSVPDR